ncbi:MAG: hypothetical protein MUC86_07555 [Burkholderiaceae bacterium]|nr:hypothetical protein [Burkholderiaceae bacterium]
MTNDLPPLPGATWPAQTGSRFQDLYSAAHLRDYARLAVEQETERLRAENESLRADAERYRWLRAADLNVAVWLRAADLNVAVINWNIGHDWIDLRFEQLDIAIDAARKP